MMREVRFSRVMAAWCLTVALVFCCGIMAANADVPGVDVSKISDMTKFNPATYENPSGVDTIKVGLIDAFSGPAAGNGQIYWMTNAFVAYDLNARGGVMVDGKRKMIEIVKGDNQGKAAQTKKVSEKLCLEDKVDLLWGNSGSHLCLITQNVAKKYKTVYVNPHSQSESTMNADNFNRYTFRPCLTSTQFAHAMAYYFKTRPERKFYILNQDYSFGHDLAEQFKDGLKKYVPDATIVGESFHPLFLKDFAPYVTKITASDAEVIFTGDWKPDAENLLKTTRQLGVNLPVANIYVTDATAYKAIGGPAGVGCVNVFDYTISLDRPSNNAFVKLFHESWKGWTHPYNTVQYKWPGTVYGQTINSNYWLYSVIERAGTTDADKVIETWEGDQFRVITGGIMKMRADDHQIIQELFATVYEFPNKFQEDAAYCGAVTVIPPEFCQAPLDPGLKGRVTK